MKKGTKTNTKMGEKKSKNGENGLEPKGNKIQYVMMSYICKNWKFVKMVK